MSMLLQELHSELRRLYIAGSDLAADDFRLKKLEPKLTALGERAPVFKRIAEGIAGLIGPGESFERAVRLQDVSTLLNSVLATQGKTDVEGTGEDVKLSPAALSNRLPDLATNRSSRELGEVRQALSSSGSGRYEVVLSAYERGLFDDLRLLPMAVHALGDSYSEITDLAAEKIVPGYGKAVVPYLLNGLDIQGGREHERRLHVVKKVGASPDDRSSLDKLILAAEEGGAKIAPAAIACLGTDPECEQRLLDWSRDAKTPMRESAYFALSVLDSETARSRLREAMSGKDAKIAARAIRSSLSPDLTEVLVRDYEEKLQDRGTSAIRSLEELRPLLIALQEARYPALERLYADIGSRPSAYPALERFFPRESNKVFEAAANYLEKSDTFEALEQTERLMAKSPMVFVRNVFPLARRVLTPEQTYERYAGRDCVIHVPKDLIFMALLQSLFVADDAVQRRRPQSEVEAEWDPRWLDWTIDHDRLVLTAGLARSDNDRLLPYWRQAIRNNRAPMIDDGRYHVLQALQNGPFDENTKFELLMLLIEARDWNRPSALLYAETALMEEARRVPCARIGEALLRIEAVMEGIERTDRKRRLQETADALRARQMEAQAE